MHRSIRFKDGTKNSSTGYEIWKFAGPDDDTDPIRIVTGGGPSPVNEAAITPCIFDGRLYVGSQLNPLSNITGGFKAADIIRINADDTWETVVGPESISGFNSGFDHWPNTYIWSMTVHEGWLYAATYDQVSPTFHSPHRLFPALRGWVFDLLISEMKGNYTDIRFPFGL